MARIPRFSDRIAAIEETVKLAVVNRCRQIRAIRIAEDQLVVERVRGFGSLQGIGSPGGDARRRDGSDPFLGESIECDSSGVRRWRAIQAGRDDGVRSILPLSWRTWFPDFLSRMILDGLVKKRANTMSVNVTHKENALNFVKRFSKQNRNITRQI